MSKNKEKITELGEILSQWVHEAGFEVIDIEFNAHKQRVLRVFIDFLEKPAVIAEGSGNTIGIDDCVAASRIINGDDGIRLDNLLEKLQIPGLLDNSFDLEVSSPGLNRKLKKPADYIKYMGKRVRILTTQPILEMGTDEKKRKKFMDVIGIIKNFNSDHVVLEVETKKKSEQRLLNIPLFVISKAQLEPDFKTSQR